MSLDTCEPDLPVEVTNGPQRAASAKSLDVPITASTSTNCLEVGR